MGGSGFMDDGIGRERQNSRGSAHHRSLRRRRARLRLTVLGTEQTDESILSPQGAPSVSDQPIVQVLFLVVTVSNHLDCVVNTPLSYKNRNQYFNNKD